MKTIQPHSFIEDNNNKKCINCGLMFIYKDNNIQTCFSFMNNAYYPIFSDNTPVTIKDFDNCRGYLCK